MVIAVVMLLFFATLFPLRLSAQHLILVLSPAARQKAAYSAKNIPHFYEFGITIFHVNYGGKWRKNV
ncbi:hypothetical protein QCE80_17020, partial [Staphylococcus aureus]|nr:hypothetical protein [Staphylococcus aureus]